MTRWILAFGALALAAPAQVGFGTLLQSIDATQAAGVSSVGVTGNPSLTTNEVTAWAQGEALGGIRSLFNAQALGLLFGDRNGDGLPFDWPDIDAMEVSAPPGGTGQPTPFDFRFSFASNVTNASGFVLVSSGDIVQLTGIGSYSIVIPRTAFQAALGTTAALNVDGYAEMADGAVLVSFQGSGTGNNIVNPVTGGPTANVAWNGADVFIIRPPFGTLPAIFAYRYADLNQVVSFYYGSFGWNEVRGIEVQPNSPGITPPLITNPSDPAGLYQSGRRPLILWTIGGDDNVFCWNNTLNPLSTNHNFYAIVGGNNGVSYAGYGTNGSTNRVIVDGLAIWPQAMTTNTRLTLDATSLTPTAGSNLTLTVRGPEAAGTRFQLAFTTFLGAGTGTALGAAGFQRLVLSTSDPLLFLTFDPVLGPFFTTGAADSSGTASTVPLLLPASLAGVRLNFQAFEISAPFELSAPLALRVL